MRRQRQVCLRAHNIQRTGRTDAQSDTDQGRMILYEDKRTMPLTGFLKLENMVTFPISELSERPIVDGLKMAVFRR